MRKLNRKDAEIILSKGSMKPISQKLKGKEVDFEKRRLIVCFNEGEAQKDKEKRKEVIQRLIEKLKTQGLKSILVNKEYRKYLKVEAKKPEINEAAIKATKIVFKKRAIVLRTELEGDASQAFKAVELKIPPRILNNPSGIQENVVVRF